MRRALCVTLIVVASFFSGGCYLMQDLNGNWWACEDIQTPNGPTTGCAPLM